MENNIKTNLEQFRQSEDLKQLNLKTKQFNIFNALKIENNEIRHSNFLAWLMSPYETHELGDAFLKEFLKNALKNFAEDNTIGTNLDFRINDCLMDTEIKREHDNIDILLFNEKLNFVCVIENKIWTKEHSCQLEKYAQIINNKFPNYKKLFIYLSPNNNCGSNLLKRTTKDNKITEYYIPMKYEQVKQAIDMTLKTQEKSMNQKAKIFVEHYRDMIERDIMEKQDKETIDLCRKIYRENKEAIDLINNNANRNYCLWQILKEFIENNEDLFSYIDYEKDCKNITCLPNGISEENVESLKFGKWKPNDIVIKLHFGLNKWEFKNGIYVNLLVSPCKEEDKARLQELFSVFKNTNLEFSSREGEGVWQQTEHKELLTNETFDNCETLEQALEILQQNFDEVKNIYIDEFKKLLEIYF